jgi:oligopeptidase B
VTRSSSPGIQLRDSACRSVAGRVQEGRLAGGSFSAGGVLLGTALNQRPSAFGAAVLRAPFVDLLTTMSDPELPMTVHEYDEWGDPGSAEGFEQVGSGTGIRRGA